MTKYEVDIEVEKEKSEWKGRMQLKGISREAFHTSAETASQVIETIGIELICLLQIEEVVEPPELKDKGKSDGR